MRQMIGARIALLGLICLFMVVPAMAELPQVEVNAVWKYIPDGSLIYNGIIKGQNGFGSIQDGINAVTPGGVVFVWPGIYYEDLSINKSVVLISEEALTDPTQPGWTGSTVIVTSTSGAVQYPGFSPHVNASGVTIRGFKINGSSDAMYVGGEGLTISNIYIDNCELTGRTSAGILVENRSGSQLSNVILSHLWAHDNPTGNGIMLSNVKGIIVASSLIEHNGVSAADIRKQYGIWITADATDLEIGNVLGGNVFSGNNAGSVYIWPGSGTGQTVTTMVINENKFLDSGFGVCNTLPSLVNAEMNWWDAPCQAGVASKTSGAVDYDPWYVNDAMTVLSSDSAAVLPAAAFSANPLEGDPPLDVTFTDQSQSLYAPITAWEWSFGDTTTSTDPDPVHQYTVPGIYNAKLKVTNCFGSNTTKVTKIKVGVKPLASFNATPQSGDAPLLVTFNDTSTTPFGYLNSWNWSFGDGTYSDSQNTTHTYDTAGTYQVKLVVKNNLSQPDTAKKNIDVSIPLPVAAFSADTVSGPAPLTVVFTDHSTSYAPYPITSWSWDFGDGGSNTLQNPSYAYLTPGTYSVTLRVANDGGTNTTIKTSYITVHPPKPKADFMANPLSGGAPLDVQFTDLTTGVVDSWKWDFGDGNTSTEQDPLHTYGAVGSYTVKLKATNAGGSNTEKKEAYISVIGAPEANFTRSPSVGGAPLTVVFTDTSTGNPDDWFWDFDDGTSSVQQNPTHVFNTIGTYNVTLTASSVGGFSDKTRTVRVIPEPDINFTGTPVLGTVPLTVQFTDTSTVSYPTFWQWDFGDGTGAVGAVINPENRNPLHTYNAPGTYNVTFTIENPAGSRTLTRTNYITVVTIPVASFTTDPSPAEGNAPFVVKFTDTTATPHLASWDFDDGTTSTEKNPVHIFNKAGIFNVTLTAQNMAGSSTAMKQVKVKMLPVASFTANTTSGIAPMWVQFSDTSAGVPTSWAWNFGDGNTSTSQHPAHRYVTPGTYTVSLTATNAAGSDKLTRQAYINVKVPLRAAFNYTTSNAANTAPLMVTFEDTSPDNPTTWEWDFGDGSTSFAQNPVHVYSNAGSYNVTLKVTNYKEWGSVTKTLQVTEPLVADFKAEPMLGSSPLTVRFQDTSVGSGITRWEWDFGDLQYFTTTNQSERNPSHTYHEPGWYSVTLNIYRGSASSEKSMENLIHVLSFP